MKVLLFVQTGDGRPKCVSVGRKASTAALCFQRDEFRNAQTSGPKDFVPRWWLVECENAEAGRTLIEMHETRHSPVIQWTGRPPAGRILASGGKP